MAFAVDDKEPRGITAGSTGVGYTGVIMVSSPSGGQPKLEFAKMAFWGAAGTRSLPKAGVPYVMRSGSVKGERKMYSHYHGLRGRRRC